MPAMRTPRFTLPLLLCTLPLACASSGETTTTTSSSSTSSGTGGGGGETSATSSSGSGGMGTGGFGGEGGIGGTGGMGGQGNADITASFVSDDFYANCMPVVAADPLYGSFTVNYQNKGSAAASLAFTDVRLRMGPPGSVVDWPFSVMPNTSGSLAAGANASVAHVKVVGSGQGSTGGPCNHCGEPLTLDVTYDDGASYSWDAGTLDCVY